MFCFGFLPTFIRMNREELTLDLGGIVLSGGKSTRMGTDKGFVPFQGKPLVQYSLSLLKYFCPDIIISANHDAYRELGYPVVEDEYIYCGPAGGLHTALKASKHEWNLVLSCDVPFVTREVLSRLIEARAGKGTVPYHDGGLEPLVAIYHHSMHLVFEQNLLLNQYRLQEIIKSADIRLLSFQDMLDKDPRLFDNLNAPDDL